MSHYCPSGPKLGIGIRGETRVYNLLFYTRSLACITELYSIFYVNGVKVIPDNIYELLTPIALAHFIMGDGTRTGSGLTLCTHNYSIQDVVRLMSVLMIKYRLICTLRMNKGKPTIYISSKSKYLLRTIVVPYMESSMLYKIGLSKLASDPVKLEKIITSSKQYSTVLNYSISTAGLKDSPAPSFKKHRKVNFQHADKISEQSQGQGTNQQEINELTNLKGFNIKFLEWFIGFAEGDGSFVVTGEKSVFSIHLHIVDLPLLYFIQNQLNMGNVYLNKKSATFIVKANKDVATLIEIFNGNIFLHKRQLQFSKWVYNYNIKNKTNIEIKPNQFQPSLNNGWLSGFTDAEGSFFVSVSKMRIVQRFSLVQKDTKPEFLFLSELLKGNYEMRKDFSRIVINFYNLDTIINYLTKYKLYSVKAKSLEKWLEIYEYRKNKPSSEKVDYSLLKKKASLINQLKKIP